MLGTFNEINKQSVRFSADGRFLDVVTKPGRRLRWKIPNSATPKLGFRRSGISFRQTVSTTAGSDAVLTMQMNKIGAYDAITVSNHSGQQVAMRQTDPNVSLMFFEETTAVSDDGRYLAMKICESPQGKFTSETPRTLAVWDINDSSQHTSFGSKMNPRRLVRYVTSRLATG